MENDRNWGELPPRLVKVLQSVAEGRCPQESVGVLVETYGFRRLVWAMLIGIQNGQIPVSGIHPFAVERVSLPESRVAAAVFTGKTDEEIIHEDGIKPDHLPGCILSLLERSGAQSILQLVAQIGTESKRMGILGYHLANMRRV